VQTLPTKLMMPPPSTWRELPRMLSIRTSQKAPNAKFAEFVFPALR
jgi:hypothetical protein